MKNKFKNEKCYLCGSQDNLTEDHIPPKCFSPLSPEKCFYKAPLCNRCNNNLSDDERKLKEFMSAGAAYKGIRSADEAYEFTRRNFKRNIVANFILGKVNKDLYRIVRNMRKVDLVTPGGIYLATRGELKIPDDIKVEEVLLKIAKGIHYRLYKEIVPYDYKTSARLIRYPEKFSEIVSLFNKLPYNGNFGDFLYFRGGAPKDDKKSGFYFLIFYKQFFGMTSFIRPLKNKGIIS